MCWVVRHGYVRADACERNRSGSLQHQEAFRESTKRKPQNHGKRSKRTTAKTNILLKGETNILLTREKGTTTQQMIGPVEVFLNLKRTREKTKLDSC
mmetsp:Transcript_6971/g.16794  ORF Transcript_6971/g.16794 Transcript_6971/m.16794 type:complete len:97 (-) Transcript_6971:1283-1573(-)